MARTALLTYEEMERLVSILAGMGVHKVRITGGEPFLRKQLPDFMQRLLAIPGIDQLNLTTNGVLTKAYIPQLIDMGIHSINLSLDTLDRQRFFDMTRRDELPKVLDCLEALIEAGIKTKINAVIMEGKNTQDIVPLAELAATRPIEVRFIEEMPFNGSGGHEEIKTWNYRQILDELTGKYPDLQKISSEKGATATRYTIPGFVGKVGIIPAFSRTFCGACNRIRITPKGTLKTCLYDNGVLDLRELIRGGASDEEVQAAFLKAFKSRAKDGYEAEKGRGDAAPIQESMSTIGG